MKKAHYHFDSELSWDTGVADGARTHDNRNHNPEFYVFPFVDFCSIININQQLKAI
ncbi:hypothetical protein [Rhodoferax sp.]|uniref:hypothetical protein n=1 Tax=Rhodoferax sp. TaxID=50421 RepID=UPI002736D389|nr:hypothetical protein [Rhodoferax sp.]MDP3191028.1 hypothetical protein [Rhodoferax sp.]MDP3335255.1 hypothetical protein [Rhodoferax sp.]MDP3864356.1 hypothetical protein [Rhodoferax sp.]